MGASPGSMESTARPTRATASKISFVSYHTRAISMNIVRATAHGRCTTPRKKLRAASAANAPAAPPRSADLLQLSVAPESECAAHAGILSTVHGGVLGF